MASVAFPVTVRVVPELSVIEPVSEVRTRLAALLVPDNASDESSEIETAPVEVNVRDPKFVVSPTVSPNVIA